MDGRILSDHVVAECAFVIEDFCAMNKRDLIGRRTLYFLSDFFNVMNLSVCPNLEYNPFPGQCFDEDRDSAVSREEFFDC